MGGKTRFYGHAKAGLSQSGRKERNHAPPSAQPKNHKQGKFPKSSKFTDAPVRTQEKSPGLSNAWFSPQSPSNAWFQPSAAGSHEREWYDNGTHAEKNPHPPPRFSQGKYPDLTCHRCNIARGAP